MKKNILYVMFILLFLTTSISLACTTAIVSGKVSVDGRPLLFKHRDSDFFQNRLVYFKDGKYDYIGLVNSEDKQNREVWAGCNSTGFAIMNSASYNLEKRIDSSAPSDSEGVIMKLALMSCSTVDEFEAMLKNLPRPLAVEANFGVIDALGNAAYFETNNTQYYKFDVNDINVAPNGYLIRTNFSFAGEKDKGYGYIRYKTAEELLKNAKKSNNLSYELFCKDVSRCLKNSMTGIDLKNIPDLKGEFIHFEDFIPRYPSTSSTTIQGIKKGESPLLTTIWAIVGFPLTSVIVPVIMGGGEKLPKILIASEDGNSILCKKSLELKNKLYPITRDRGTKYIKYKELYKSDGNGLMQKAMKIEDSIVRTFNDRLKYWREKKLNTEELQNFYNWVDTYVEKSYKEKFGI